MSIAECRKCLVAWEQDFDHYCSCPCCRDKYFKCPKCGDYFRDEDMYL